MSGIGSHAHPTHRRNTNSTLRPPPRASFRCRSRGATSPIRGTGPTATGGGGGENHGWTVNGRDLTDIHDPQLPVPPSSMLPLASLLLAEAEDSGGAESLEKSRALLGRPIFFRASLVVRLDSITGWPSPFLFFFWRGKGDGVVQTDD